MKMSNDHIKDLEKKLSAFRRGEQKPDIDAAVGLNDGARAGLEFVVSIVAGGGIGWLLDGWLGTKPWFFIIFLFLGVGAGFMSVYRINNNLGSGVGFAPLQKPQKTATKPPEIPDDEDDE